MEDIVIIGYGGHAKSIADSIENAGIYKIVGYTDNKACNCRYTYLGTDDALKDLYKKGIRRAVIGVGFLGNSNVRDHIAESAKEIGYEFPAIIDKTAVIANDVSVGEGSFIGKSAIVNADSVIGNFCIVNTGAIIEHENAIGDHSHIAVGVILCGEVTVGHHTMIGAGTTVIQCRKIGNDCIIGANSTVLSDVEDHSKVYGVVKDKGIKDL